MRHVLGRPNIPLLVISFILSVTLWFVVQAQSMQVKDMMLSVPVKYDNLDPRFVITRMDDAVLVKAVGPGDKLSDPNIHSAEAIVDLTNAEIGTHSYYARIESPDSDVQRLLPGTGIKVRVDIDAKASKSFTVIVDPKGRISDHALRYDVSSVTPSEVLVSGSQGAVNSIQKVRALLELSDIDPKFPERTFSLPIEALDSRGRPVPYVIPSVSLVKIHPTVEPATVDKELFIVPTFVGHPAPGYEIQGYVTRPDRVIFTGSSLALARTSSVSTDPIDVTGMTKSDTREASLTLPPELKMVEPRPIFVRINVVRQSIANTSPTVTPPKASGPPPFPDRVPPITTGGGAHE